MGGWKECQFLRKHRRHPFVFLKAVAGKYKSLE